MLPFDKDGRCTGPRTRERVIAESRAPEVTDVFVFSHGWNNNWKAATERYQSFVAGFGGVHQDGHGLKLEDGYQPLLVGVFWPSVILVAPGERAPAIAGGDQDPDLDELTAALPEKRAARLAELVSDDEPLDLAEARELAEIAASLYAGGDDEGVEVKPSPPTPDELLAAWRPVASARARQEPGSWGTVDDGRAAAPTSAGFSLDPRKALRLMTVRAMKDRAGVVGTRGVGPLLRDLLEAGGARVHMIGHSYGAKVCLSAICAEQLPRRVDSALLLQPAINHRCFAVDADGKDRPGGYRVALDRVEQPILTTYSAHDEALTRWFHKALTRDGDEGEAEIAAWPEPPSRFAALGGYGPRGAEQQTHDVELLDPPSRYPRDARIVAVNATRGIPDHGEISNPYTWWALYDQVAGP
jgi:hypothetical protein